MFTMSNIVSDSVLLRSDSVLLRSDSVLLRSDSVLLRSTPFYSVPTPFYSVPTPFYSVPTPFYSVPTPFYSVLLRSDSVSTIASRCPYADKADFLGHFVNMSIRQLCWLLGHVMAVRHRPNSILHHDPLVIIPT